ncbi:MAG: transporter substrate-binding domain-containing protein, partial [Candidatus Omnitrophica bacterium]|nr:transporter substrate-binding domain-containing protein [Candidatus Omnitrophota bacterium]
NEPFELREKRIDFNLITPQSYGVDYYGDNFFTTENEIREHPDRVRKVIDATLKGWKYAIENPDEVIDTIIEKYSPGSKREKLAYEAKETLKLIAPELTPLGEINPSRFRTFAQQMATMGVVEEGKVPPGFIFPARLQPAIPLSNEQLEWLEGHPDVSLGFASNFEPLFWLDDQGRQQGVLSDMLDLLNQRLGTRIEVVTADWGDTVDSASMGELDGLLAIPEEMVGQLGMRGTHSYLSLLPTVFAKEGTVNKLKTLSDLRGKKVAVLARVDSLNRLLDPLEGDVEILKGGTARDCLEMVFQGKADATIGFPFYDEAIVRHFFTDIAPAFIFWDKPIQAVIGVRSDWPELVEILNLGIDSITSEKRNQIISKWSSRISEEQVELPRRESEWLARHPVISVLVPKSSSPFIYTDSEGRERGIYVDFLKALGKRLGVRIQTRSVTFAEYSEEIFDKRSAILAVGPKSEIGEVEGYQWSNPVGYSHTAVFSKTGERRLSMNDLGDRIIGYSSSVSNDTPGFERFLKAKQTIGIDNPDEAISKLLSGEIDGYFDYYPVFNHQLKKAMVSDIEAVYVHPTPISANLLVKDDQGPLLSSVNRAIEAMENEEIPRLLSKWRFTEPAQENKRVHFSVKEDEWISSKPTVRVGADGCLTPVSWVDSRGGVEGMSVDFLDKVSEMTGVRFEFVCSSTWQDLEDMIEAGDVDVIAGLAPTDSKRRTMEFTDPIVSSPAMVFADEDYPVIDDLSELAGSRVGVVGGGAVEEWVSNDFPLLELVPVSNSHEGIVWLGDRKIDVFIGDLLTTTQRIKREGLANI